MCRERMEGESQLPWILKYYMLLLSLAKAVTSEDKSKAKQMIVYGQSKGHSYPKKDRDASNEWRALYDAAFNIFRVWLSAVRFKQPGKN